MIKTRFNLILVVLTLFFSACSGGDGGGGGGAALEGTWLGAGYDDLTMAFAQYQVVIDADRNVTSVSADGVDQGLTGKIRKTSDSVVFSFELSDGTEGCFIVNASKDYAYLASATEDFYAVLQKGAASLPAFAATDIFNKSYSGKGVEFDGNFSLVDTTNSTLQIFAGGGFSGTDGAMSFNHAPGGEMAVLDINHGVWIGNYESNGPAGFFTGEVVMFLSPDKSFIGAGGCNDMGVFPIDCKFFAWKQN